MSMFGGTGGYFRLDSGLLAKLGQRGTQRFCKLFLNRTNDPCGRQYDQMTQAARSGRANIVEGSERAGTSKGTEMRLADVAGAGLAELKGDYEFWVVKRKRAPGKVPSPEAQAVWTEVA